MHVGRQYRFTQFLGWEGGANDVPISFIARRIEIEMRIMLGEEADLKPIEARHDILF